MQARPRTPAHDRFHRSRVAELTIGKATREAYRATRAARLPCRESDRAAHGDRCDPLVAKPNPLSDACAIHKAIAGARASATPRIASSASVQPRKKSPPLIRPRRPVALRMKWLRGSEPAINQGRGSPGHRSPRSQTGRKRSNRPASALAQESRGARQTAIDATVRIRVHNGTPAVAWQRAYLAGPVELNQATSNRAGDRELSPHTGRVRTFSGRKSERADLSRQSSGRPNAHRPRPLARPSIPGVKHCHIERGPRY